MCQLFKYINFIKKYNDIPFVVKRRVLNAALMSSVLYGCESWIGADLAPVAKIYNWAIKELLDVKLTTCNDLCYIEGGFIPLKSIVMARQRKYLKRILTERSSMVDDPLNHALKLIAKSATHTSRTIRNLTADLTNDDNDPLLVLQTKISNSDSSRITTYKTYINPNLTTHPIYSTKHSISEHHRKAFTRFRISAHSLAVETGRWNRKGRGRLPLEERLCSCGEPQTEKHVVEDCPLSRQLRLQYNVHTIEHLFSNSDHDITCNFIFQLLNIYR